MPPTNHAALPPGPNPACEAHSVAIAVLQTEVDSVKDDMDDHKEWRKGMDSKIDGLKKAIQGLEVRLYAIFVGAAVLAWAFEHWFKK